MTSLHKWSSDKENKGVKRTLDYLKNNPQEVEKAQKWGKGITKMEEAQSLRDYKHLTNRGVKTKNMAKKMSNLK